MVWRCGAVYHGRRPVQGTQSQSTLTAIVDTIVREDGDPNQLHPFTKGVGKGERCQVVVEEERFVVVSGGVRGPGGRDEGFESDSESSAGSNNCDDHCCAIHDIKVISDHVLRLDALLQQEVDSGSAGFASASSSSSSTSSSDDASSATSSGAESEDDTPRNHKQASTNGACCNGASAIAGDVFLLSDILFCHVDAATPRIVVLVVKDAGSSLIHAHVYETSSDEQARTLFQHYKEASNKYKLNRYRNSKRKLETPKNLSESSGSCSVSKNSGISGKLSLVGGDGKNSISGTSINSVSGDGKNSISGTSINSVSDSERKLSSSSTDSGVSRGFDGPGRASIRSVEARLKAQGKNNVNVIEIRETTLEEGETRAEGGSRANWNLLQHTDENGVTHIEIESGPCSIASNSSSKSGEATTSSEYSSMVSLSAPESSPDQISGAQSLPPRPSSRADNLTAGGSLRGSSGQPNSLPQPPTKEVLVAGEKDKKFRQRQPARFLRTDENGLQNTAGIVIGGKLIGGGAQDTRKLENKRQDERKEEFQERKKRDERRGDDRESRSRRDRHEDRNVVRDSHRSATVDPHLPRPERQSRARDQSRGRARHSKGPAPPPPPRRHPSNPSLMLVPTKSGAENARAFYPKESHIVRGNKIVRVEFPGYHGWGIHHDGSSSPHSHHQYAYYPHGSTQAWIGPHEYHAASRPRDSTITPEMRRRSRSKSPARRPMAHRYIDAMSNFNISQKLKDIKDAVVTRAQNGPNIVNNLSTGESRGHQRSASTVSAPPDVSGTETESGLKPVIKKGRRPVTDDNRRVTFSAYATVQVMDV